MTVPRNHNKRRSRSRSGMGRSGSGRGRSGSGSGKSRSRSRRGKGRSRRGRRRERRRTEYGSRRKTAVGVIDIKLGRSRRGRKIIIRQEGVGSVADFFFSAVGVRVPKTSHDSLIIRKDIFRCDTKVVGDVGTTLEGAAAA
jgi:hypothetical protein